MDDTRTAALDLFGRGFNCAQAVFAAHHAELGLGRDLALRLATPFGGGLTGRQGMCGALMGAILVLGARQGKDREGDDEAKARTYQLVREFEAAFAAEAGADTCRELLGYDWSTEEGRARHASGDDRARVCVPCVETALRLLGTLPFRGGTGG